MVSKNSKNLALSGGFAVGEAIKQINPDVVAVYPITPQTPVIEYFAKKVADGEASTEIIPVESEHSAMSACIGASASGARAITASSSQGIMYMLETLPIASVMRLPIVMAVANRAISGPLNIHGDHSDAMAMRDTGWIQLFSENAQEAYDQMLLGLKVSEAVLLPLAVNFDGFITSHSVENIELLQDKTVERFIKEYRPKQSLLDFKKPVTFGALVLSNAYFEFRKQVNEAMATAEKSYEKFAKEYKIISNRNYSCVQEYKTKDATKVIVAMGSVCGTIKEVVDRLRAEGQKVGLLKIRMFRPFPYARVKKALAKVDQVIVLDRALLFGTRQALATEIECARGGKTVKSLVYGLGGREVTEKQIEEIFQGKHQEGYLMN